jgi:hypothetical protein
MQQIDGRFSEYVAVLSPTTAMIGGIGNKEKVVPADRSMVEHIRGVTISNAARYVYAPLREIEFARPDGTFSSLEVWVASGKPAELDLFLTEYKV